MKKAISILINILLSLVLVLSFTACGGGTAPTTAEKNESKPTEATTDSKTPAVQSEKETKGSSAQATNAVSYEITYQDNKMWVNSIGTTWMQTIVEITNTGNVPLYFGSASYDLEDESGDLLASQSMVSVFPTVLDVGEKGYIYEETTFDGEVVENVTIIPHLKVEKATIDLIRYKVSDIKISDNSFGGIKVIGRVENSTSEDSSMPEVAVFLYDKSSNPIGIVYTYMDDLPSGEKKGFEATGFSLPDSITADSVADYTALAYPGMQFQF